MGHYPCIIYSIISTQSASYIFYSSNCILYISESISYIMWSINYSLSFFCGFRVRSSVSNVVFSSVFLLGHCIFWPMYFLAIVFFGHCIFCSSIYRFVFTPSVSSNNCCHFFLIIIASKCQQ